VISYFVVTGESAQMAAPAKNADTGAKKPEQKKLDTFIWEGKKSGTMTKGEIQAVSEAAAKALLRKQAVNVVKIRKKPKPLFGGAGKRGKKIEAGDISIFARQMTTMMGSGVPLIQSFEIVGRGHDNPNMEKLIMDIKGFVEAGGTFADALRQHPDHFDSLFCNLVEAGEQAGILEDLLSRIALYKEKSESIKKKIKKAMTYPTAVLVFAVIVTAVLMIFVVPVFGNMFKEFGGQLPALTQLIVDISDFMVASWYMVFGGIFIVIYTFTQAKKRSVAFQHALQRFSLKIPIFGDILNKAAVARFARTLSTMFAAGTPLVEALVSVAGATGNIVYSDAVLKMRDDVAAGTQLNVSMADTGIFPNMVVQMCTIGEESGALDAMLGKVADFYEEEVDNLVDNLSQLIEPMIMAFLAVVIGGLVVGMYLPIFKMGEVI
jgi:type IV pilus assembly protein PilC